MGYIEANLMSGETVVYRARLHWILFFWPVLFLVVALVAYGGEAPLFGLLSLSFALLTGLPRVITYVTSEFGLTNKRVILKVGFIRRHSLETLLQKIEGIAVDQGILGRVLGFGTITVTGTGGMRDPFHMISQPLVFRRKIHEQISSADTQGAPEPIRAPVAASVPSLSPGTLAPPPQPRRMHPLQVRFCEECGAQVEVGSKFCEDCGAPVT